MNFELENNITPKDLMSVSPPKLSGTKGLTKLNQTGI
jgi:hypothetical protein